MKLEFCKYNSRYNGNGNGLHISVYVTDLYMYKVLNDVAGKRYEFTFIAV
jgi:hypothetical protein